jgi:hypothetical protein
MIDVESETLVQFPDARSAFPGDRRISLATLHRWRQKGVRGVKLETKLIGGFRYTSREAIARFIEAQNADDVPCAPAITPAQRRRQSEAARQELVKIGVASQNADDVPATPASTQAQRRRRQSASVRQELEEIGR